MTSTEFWDFFHPLSAKSVLVFRKFAAFLDPLPPSLRTSYMEAPERNREEEEEEEETTQNKAGSSSQ